MEINRCSGGTGYWELLTGWVTDAEEGGIELESILWVEEMRGNPQFLKGKKIGWGNPAAGVKQVALEGQLMRHSNACEKGENEG